MGHTFRRDDTYGYKRDYRERNDRKVKKLNKKLRKITNQQQLVKPSPPQEGTELV